MVRVTPRCSGSQNPSAFLVCCLSLDALYFYYYLSTSPHRAACPQDLFFWAEQAVESYKLPWQQIQITSTHCSDTRFCQSEDLRNTQQVSAQLLSSQRKLVSSSAYSHQTLQEQHSSLEHQLSPATTSSFSSKTGNAELSFNTIA